MNRYQIINLDIDDNDYIETIDIAEALKKLAATKADIEDTGYEGAQLLFRVLDDHRLEKLVEVHRYENKQWKSFVLTQDNLEQDVIPGEQKEEAMSIEKIYWLAKFGPHKPTLELTTLTYVDNDKQVKTIWAAVFNDERLEVSKEEYDFLLKGLEEAK